MVVGGGPPSGRHAGLKWTDNTGPARGLAAGEAIERRAHSKQAHAAAQSPSQLPAFYWLLSRAPRPTEQTDVFFQRLDAAPTQRERIPVV